VVEIGALPAAATAEFDKAALPPLVTLEVLPAFDAELATLDLDPPLPPIPALELSAAVLFE